MKGVGLINSAKLTKNKQLIKKDADLHHNFFYLVTIEQKSKTHLIK